MLRMQYLLEHEITDLQFLHECSKEGHVKGSMLAVAVYAGKRDAVIHELTKAFTPLHLHDEWFLATVWLLDHVWVEAPRLVSRPRDLQTRLLAAPSCMLKFNSSEAELSTLPGKRPAAQS